MKNLLEIKTTSLDSLILALLSEAKTLCQGVSKPLGYMVFEICRSPSCVFIKSNNIEQNNRSLTFNEAEAEVKKILRSKNENYVVLEFGDSNIVISTENDFFSATYKVSRDKIDIINFYLYQKNSCQALSSNDLASALSEIQESLKKKAS